MTRILSDEPVNVRRRARYQRDKEAMKDSKKPFPANIQKFTEIPTGIDRFDIAHHGKTIKRYKEEIEGMSWTLFEEKIYRDGVPPGRYNYSMKLKDSKEIYTGVIKSVGAIIKEDHEDNSKELNELNSRITSLSETLKKTTNEGELKLSFILDTTKALHDAQIQTYLFQLGEKDKIISKLEKENDGLNDELDKAELIIGELKQSGEQNKYIQDILGLVNRFTSSQQLSGKVKLDDRFNGKQIPDEIVVILDNVDYSQLPPEKYQNLKNGLIMIVNQLPRRG